MPNLKDLFLLSMVGILGGLANLWLTHSYKLSEVTLDEAVFPNIENPLMPIMQDTPVTPTSLNLPSIDQSVMTQSQAANQFSNLTMDQKIRLLFPNG